MGAVRGRGLHASLDTCAHAAWERLRAAATLAAVVLRDLKAVGCETQQRATAVGNGIILADLDQSSEEHTCLWARKPVVPGVKRAGEKAAALADVLAPLTDARRGDPLPYHPVGRDKAAPGPGAPETAQGDCIDGHPHRPRGPGLVRF